MSEPSPVSLAASDLGGPGAPDATRSASQAIAAMTRAAGSDLRLASLSIDVTSHPLGDAPVTLTVKIDKRARSISFASCEARSGEQLVFSAQALFSR